MTKKNVRGLKYKDKDFKGNTGARKKQDKDYLINSLFLD